MKRISQLAISFVCLSILAFNAAAQTDSRSNLIKTIQERRAELALLEKQVLEPSEQDKMAHAEFLRQSDTGLVRLLPREKYDDNAYKEKTKPSVTIRGGGAYYSFTMLSHDYNSGAPQISLENKKLSVGFAGANYGILTTLGNVSLEEITIDHPSVQFMANYEPPNEETSARLEARRFVNGVSIGEARYTRSEPAKVDTTYLLRSISFISADVLVALRIVRQDTDGSMIIAWKLLKKYPTPTFAQK
ncbi:MAG TPA: hypothetical protein VJU86_18695 [Pyrinomonadaceae bacterium]|nr:hypothetical protein [Pyrinomonadaceae bacterium]